MTRALVTGAAGFIGAHVVEALGRRGVDVVPVARAEGARLRGLPFVRADLAAEGVPAAIVREHRPDVVVHLAWYARPDDYLTSRENVASLEATVALSEAAAAAGCRILGVGTCLEYGPSERPHREDDPAAPDTPYAACKHAARLLSERLAAERGASFAWARVFHVFGPGEDPRRLVPMVAARLRRGEAVDLSAGAQVRDYLRVEDVADALATIALADVRGAVNVCSGRGVALRDLLSEVGSVLGRPELLRFGRVALRPGERRSVVGAPDRLRALGWSPRLTESPGSMAYLREAST